MSVIGTHSTLNKNSLGLILAIFLGCTCLGLLIGSELIPSMMLLMGITGIGYFLISVRSPYVGLVIYVVAMPWLHINLSYRYSETGIAAIGSTFTLSGAIKDVLLILLVGGFIFNELGRLGAVKLKNNNSHNINIGFWPVYITIAAFYALASPELLPGLWALRGVIEFSLIFILVQRIIDNVDKAIFLLKAFALTGFVVGTFSLLRTSVASITSAQQAFGGSQNFVVGAVQFGHATSRGVYATYIGTVAIVGISFLLVYKGDRLWQIMMLGATSVGLVTMILTFERRGVVGFLVAGLVILILTRSFSRWTLIIGVLLSGLIIFFVAQPEVYQLYSNRFNFNLNANINLQRVSLLEFYWKMAMRDYFLGRGLGTVGNFATSFRGFYEFSPHNYYLLLLVEGGFPLLLAFIATNLRVFYQTIKLNFSSMQKEQFVLVSCLSVCASFLVQGFFSDFLEIFPFNFYLWLFLGLTICVTRFQTDIPSSD